MKRKILIFSLSYYPKHIGGAEVAIKEITERLSTDEYEFHLLCNRYDTTLPKEEMVGAVMVHRIGYATKNPSMSDLKKIPLHLNKIIYQWQAFWVAKKLHKKYKFDGIWAMMAHATGVPAGKFKKRFPDVKYVLTLQEGDPPQYIEQKMKIFGTSFRDAFTTADKVQVISSFLGNWAKSMGAKTEPVLIPNAVNTTHFSQVYSDTELKKIRSGWNLSELDTILITTSRLVHKNGIDTVIDALQKMPDVSFVICGTGPDEELLREKVTEYKLHNKVHFAGQISHEEMPKYLKAADIFIRPSRSEGMGNSFIEAMAAGLPVIATREGGIADFLFDAKRNPNHKSTGWAVSPNTPLDIVEAVKSIQLDTEQTKETVKTAKEMVLTSYDWNLIAKRMDVEVFKTILPEA